jgi:hypothetical protein
MSDTTRLPPLIILALKKNSVGDYGTPHDKLHPN